MAAQDSLHSLLDYECLLFHCDEWRTKNQCLLNRRTPLRMSNESSRVESYATTDGQSASLSCNEAPSGAYDQIYITVRHLRVCWCGALCLTRGRVCHLQILLALASAVILGSESREPRDHILLSQIGDFPFRRLLRLGGLRWKYSTPPPHGICRMIELTSRRPEYRSASQTVPLLFCFIRCHGNVLTEPLPSNWLPVWIHCSGFQESCNNIHRHNDIRQNIDVKTISESHTEIKKFVLQLFTVS
jgi:hypothetical protein